MDEAPRERPFFQALIGDGRPAIILTGAALVFAGGFALFLGISGQFLPQDVAYLGLTPKQLCHLANCRVVDFMVHDRIAFGGSLIAIGSIYVWLALYPLAAGHVWAWYTLLLTGVAGFGSFLTYVGYGYLDTWHGLGTFLLLPVFIVGLVRTRAIVQRIQVVPVLAPERWAATPSGRVGRTIMLGAAAAMAASGLIVMTVGVTSVFVPQDLQFMGTTRAALESLNPHLVPLMAHDRAGFGGGVFTTGLAAFLCVWWSRPSPSLWRVLGFSWLALAGSAIGIHLGVGYTSFTHIAPAVAGAGLFGLGLILARRSMVSPKRSAPTA